VLDVGGTTTAAAWVPLDRLGDLPVTRWLLPLLARVLDRPALAGADAEPYDVGQREPRP
jgi:hypothetical protein